MKSSLRILLAPDSFKGSLRAHEVCNYLKKGLEAWGSDFIITELPLADGGEGTVDALVRATGGAYCSVQVHDPLMRPVTATYGLINNGEIAVIEMAEASGLELLSASELNPLITTTFGTGELIADALNRGCRRFIIGIGGSATNDGGTGMLEALGVRLEYRGGGQQISKGGGVLSHLSHVDISTLDSRLHESHFQIACDVTNPLTGPEGATRIFASQKGARQEDLNTLEEGLHHWGQMLEQVTGKVIANKPGAGAAGGLGAGLLALPHSELRSGFDIVQQAADLKKHLLDADIVITGEGRVDGQTAYGKVVSEIGRMAARHEKPVICVAGTLESESRVLLNRGISMMLSIVNKPMSLQEAIASTPQLLEETALNIGGLLRHFNNELSR